MITDFIYQYPPLIAGILKKRYQRFLADIELKSGEVITAHCANTGPMRGVCTPGSRVQVSRSDNPKRKLPYTWEMIEVNDPEPTWVGINTGLPNRIIKLALSQQLIPELAGKYGRVRSEVTIGKDKKSRLDFVLTGNEPQAPIYLEVKNTTLAENQIALFPDTETTRGQKHLQELMALVAEGKAVMLYFINRGDCTHFAPGDKYDPTYGKLFREALSKGVEILPCRFEINPQGVKYLGLAELKYY
jgi:sugar fermentation stimulation protein A